MICTLNRAQKEGTLKILGRVVKKKAFDSPEEVLKNVYHAVFEEFAKKGLQKDAEPYAFAMTQYAADNLYILMDEDTKRKLFSEVLGTQDQFTLDNIERFKTEEELRRLLGLKDVTVANVPSEVKKEDVSKHLDKISESFPPLTAKTTYVQSQLPLKEWDFTIAKREDGTDVKLVSVSDFLNLTMTKSQLQADNLKIRAGNLTDLTIRKFFKEPMAYDKFQEKIVKDKDFIAAFLKFTENSASPKMETNELINRYMEEFLKDAMYAINFIQTNYPDSYITDLTDMVENSSLPLEQKRKFFIYSSEIGLRGELDLIAINKDGTFTILDIKTTDGYRTSTESLKHSRQASIYDLIISKSVKLKSSGENHIIYLTTSVANPTSIMGDKKTTGNNKLAITNYEKKVNKNVPTDDLLMEIDAYKKQIDTAYTNVKVIPQNSSELSVFSPFSPLEMQRGRKRLPPTDKPLNQIFDPNSELSTYPSLVKGKDWLHKVFPELEDISVEIINMVNSPNGGQFFIDAIILNEKSNEGVAYHEGWHRFTQLYLTQKEKTKLYNQVKADNIKFKTRDGRELTTRDASFLDIEEFMADQFVAYVKSPDSYTFPKGNPEVKSLFRKIWDAIKAIALFWKDNGVYSYETLFKELHTGSFNRTKFSANNAIFHQLNSLYMDSVTGKENLIDNLTWLKYRDFADYTLSQYLAINDITISELLTDTGVDELRIVLRDAMIDKRAEVMHSREQLKEAMANTTDELVKSQMKANDDYFKYHQDVYDILLEQDKDGNYIRFNDFMRAFYRTSTYESLRRFTTGENKERINKLLEEDSAMPQEKDDISGDEKTDEEDDKAPDGEDDFTEFNNPGNLKAAIENAKAELKDFFAGIPRRISTDLVHVSDPSMYEYGRDNLPAVLNKKEAFYKTLNILQGALTLEMIEQRLNSVDNNLMFPELIFVKEKLFGHPTNGNEGLVNKLKRLTAVINEGTQTEIDIDEHSKLLSFMMHFAHVLSLRKVPFDVFVIRANYDKPSEFEIRQGKSKTYTIPPLQTREALESIIFSILMDFTQGFQVGMDEKFLHSDDRNFKNVYDILFDLFGQTEADAINAANRIPRHEFIYDPQYKKFYFNSAYVHQRFETSNPSVREMKDFFSYMGIKLNDKVYESDNDRTDIIQVYNRLKKILDTFHVKTLETIGSLRDNTNLRNAVIRWKAAKIAEQNPQLEGLQKHIARTNVIDAEIALNKYTNLIFSSNPVNQLLFDGTDTKLMNKDSKYKVFAANLNLFRQLARVEKKYHKRYSSGSMLVLDKLQFSHFLPNNMLVTESLINDHINNMADFGEYYELSHLNPMKQPQVMNSMIMKGIFNEDGSKRPGMKLGVSVISQVSYISPSNIVESKRIQDLRGDEKMVIDLFMYRSDGSAEMRRMEASNTGYRVSLQRMIGNDRGFVKFVNFKTNDSFNNPSFTSIIGGYIQHAAWKYLYYRNEENRELDIEHKKIDKTTDRRDGLGVFDEMLPLTAPKIKTFIKENRQLMSDDMNALMATIEQTDEELFKDINIEIAKYFEGVAIRNEDSYKNDFAKNVSDKSLDMLAAIAGVPFTQTLITLDNKGLPHDYIYRDVIANDFIMAMEDAILFFGDYSYYKDPIKRRKIIANNGSINMTGRTIADALAAQNKAYSIAQEYRDNKKIEVDKNYNLVSKSIIQDPKVTSNLLREVNGVPVLLQDIQELRQQRYGVNVSIEQLRIEKQDTIDAFTDMEIADAAAYIGLDMLRQMRIREMTWDWNLDEDEYRRQIFINRKNLNIPITASQQTFIDKGPYASFNVSKFALTGPVYGVENSPFKPTFDKMGLRVLLPEMDWNNLTRPIFEQMMKQALDYVVYDTGSKGYKSPITEVFGNNGKLNKLKSDLNKTDHAGGYFKFQQNTTHITEQSTLSIQLRGIFHEIMLIQDKYGIVHPSLKQAYSKVIQSLSDYITINSSRALTDMGLNIEGKMRDKATFINYIKERLLEIGDVDETLISLLDKTQGDEFTNYLEVLPFQKNVLDLISGVIDDNFRKIKLNGSKFYQSPELGTTLEINVEKLESLPESERGTVELKWHGLERVNGKIVSTTPVEAKMGFRKQFYPLLNLKHPDGERIVTLKRLNEALRNTEWAKSNYDSITFVGVRIPLQDINFTSHVILKEFLPETAGDTIILPPEFYKQTGGDNDIDTITATLKYLDEHTGKVIKRPTESYIDLINEINELSTKISTSVVTVVKDVTKEERLQRIKDKFLDANVYASKNAGTDVMDREFTIVDDEGYFDLSGMKSKKSVLHKLIKNTEFNELTAEVEEFINWMNEGTRGKIKNEDKKKLNTLRRKKAIYLKGVTNDITTSIMKFLEQPETFDYLTETDSIRKIADMAKNIIAMKTDVDPSTIKLGQQQSSLEAMSMQKNLVNHSNNFEQRPMLGSVIKFRSILTLLSSLDTSLQNDYLAGAMQELLKITPTDRVLLKDLGKTYTRNIYTPLLYKKDTTKGIKISIFDENGGRTTKNLSMLASSLLDLFKNVDIYPSLGLTWMEVKPFLFLLAQGVPMERALLFINNPIVQEAQNELYTLGSDARDKHALVSLAQKLLDDEMFSWSIDEEGQPKILKPGDFPDKGAYDVKSEDSSGRIRINNFMRRPGKAAEAFLNKKHITFSEDALEEFTRDYGKFNKSSKVIVKSLREFIRINPKYKEFAQDILAYYGTLLEDGDIFYAYFVKGLNRNSAKTNSRSATATQKATQAARVATGMVNPEFEDRLREGSPYTPFYNDKVIENVLANSMPNLLNHPDLYFRNAFAKALEQTVNMTHGTLEDKRKVELAFLADFIEMSYKYFYIHKTGPNTGNTLFEHYQFDIVPMLAPLMAYKGGEENFRKFMDDFRKNKEALISEDARIESLYNESLLANQVEVFRAKYPELRALAIVRDLLPLKQHGIDPHREINLEAKDVFNLLSQSYVTLNMSKNPDERQAAEVMMRDEWDKLINFNLAQFPSIQAAIAKDTERIDFYNNPENIEEIQKLWNTLAYYSLAQASHLTKNKASFSYLAPPNIIKKVVKEGIDNMNRYIMTAGSPAGKVSEAERTGAIDAMLTRFTKMFKDMNGNFKWKDASTGDRVKPRTDYNIEDDENFGTDDMIYNPRRIKDTGGLPYMKSHTGKLYSKIEDAKMEFFQKTLLKEAGITTKSKNDFQIATFSKPQDDALNEACEI